MPPTPSQHAISLRTAAALSGLSVRTWQRRVEQGQVPRLDGAQQAQVPLAAVQPDLDVVLDAADADLLVRADDGDAAAQADVGALFALDAVQRAREDADHPERGQLSATAALYFLGQAAAQGEADAMHWLGTLHGAGLGGQRGRAAESLTLMWTARAAAHGHVVAQGQMARLTERVLALGASV